MNKVHYVTQVTRTFLSKTGDFEMALDLFVYKIKFDDTLSKDTASRNQ